MSGHFDQKKSFSGSYKLNSITEIKNLWVCCQFSKKFEKDFSFLTGRGKLILERLVMNVSPVPFKNGPICHNVEGSGL